MTEPEERAGRCLYCYRPVVDPVQPCSEVEGNVCDYAGITIAAFAASEVRAAMLALRGQVPSPLPHSPDPDGDAAMGYNQGVAAVVVLIDAATPEET